VLRPPQEPANPDRNTAWNGARWACSLQSRPGVGRAPVIDHCDALCRSCGDSRIRCVAELSWGSI
jgi:hypothetical protein